MADKVTIELDSKYKEHLDLLKQVIPSADGAEITEDSKMVEALIDSFMSFIQEQATAHANNEDTGSCGGGGNGEGGCGCSH